MLKIKFFLDNSKFKNRRVAGIKMLAVNLYCGKANNQNNNNINADSERNLFLDCL